MGHLHIGTDADVAELANGAPQLNVSSIAAWYRELPGATRPRFVQSLMRIVAA